MLGQLSQKNSDSSYFFNDNKFTQCSENCMTVFGNFTRMNLFFVEGATVEQKNNKRKVTSNMDRESLGAAIKS